MDAYMSSLLSRARTLLPSILAVLALVTTAWWAKAQVDAALVVPRLIPYEGFLELDGSPLEGTRSISFELFDTIVGGESLWAEVHEEVAVADGHFSVVLGQSASFRLTVINSPALYLQIAVDGAPLTGRQRFVGASGVASGHGVPPGSIIAFAGPQPPAGWLVCDGQPVSRANYANLFEAIGEAHGAGDGASTFNLPDYRGRFLRGVDQGVGRDANAASRSASAAGGAIGDNVGSVQNGATALPEAGFVALEAGAHAHSYADNSGWSCDVTPDDPDTSCGESGLRSDLARTTDGAGAHSHNVSGGDAETRPINAAVYWIIKY